MPDPAYSVLQFITRFEYPANRRQAAQHKHQDHGNTDADINIGYAVKAPAETTDQVNHRVEQGHLLPEWRQHIDRVEGAAEKGQWCNNHHRDDLQFLKIIGPQSDDKAEQTEGHRGKQ